MHGIEQHGHPLDLVIERMLDVAPEAIWRAWTRPEQLKRWFTPAPGKTLECEIDPRPGGILRALMRFPDGMVHELRGCWLELVPDKKLIWTDVLGPGFRPAAKPFITVEITMEPSGERTRYVSRAMHKDASDRDSHIARGFESGWNLCIDQMVAVIGETGTD